MEEIYKLLRMIILCAFGLAIAYLIVVGNLAMRIIH